MYFSQEICRNVTPVFTPVQGCRVSSGLGLLCILPFGRGTRGNKEEFIGRQVSHVVDQAVQRWKAPSKRHRALWPVSRRRLKGRGEGGRAWIRCICVGAVAEGQAWAGQLLSCLMTIRDCAQMGT